MSAHDYPEIDPELILAYEEHALDHADPMEYLRWVWREHAALLRHCERNNDRLGIEHYSHNVAAIEEVAARLKNGATS